ncbi:LRR receptor-like serine/threonine-protein kinase GSO2-like [Planoprotostelium fungivorum]|uniref:LRR receptor-like serine/threonine-protein kinase GSO2-like n=1 Tax=Planoprotostelium fungivorum TaxID=1890364 RepID=A0A2P6NC01_9EUKA|nr:LRR receptor-like serine/threonine-protein kinase GSO2-like [Planoprotostelium fungivorum]
MHERNMSCLCAAFMLFLIFPQGCQASSAILVSTMQTIWSSFNGPTGYWAGNNVCNSNDYVGVTCDPSNTWPVRLNLQNGVNGQRLNGAIHSVVGSLTNLTQLQLESNAITGTIPNSLCQLTQLTDLHLDGNQLTGSIPTCIGNLNQVTDLILNGNQLTGSIPDSIGNLSAVYNLYLQGNQLSGSIPSTMGNLNKVYRVFLQSNQLSGSIPTSIFSLPSLQSIDLSANQLTGSLPSTINLPSIVFFLAYENQLSGTLPGALFTQPAIGQINLSHNQFSGTIPDVGFSSSFFSLSLNNNPLQGDVPPQIINLPNLGTLWLSSTGLTGSIGSRNSQLNAMTELHLDYSQFTSVGYISVTSVCSVGNNPFPCYPLQNVSALCNNIPPCPLLVTMRGIWQTLGGGSQYWTGPNMCDSTDYVDVTCDATNNYPIRLNLQNGVSGTKLNGIIPSTIGSLSNLTQLQLEANAITGTIPDSLCQLTLLTDLHLDNNQLTGSIPTCIGNLNQVTDLILNGNQLTGSIPDSIGNLAAVYSLYLHDNQLSGPIPSTMGNLNKLFQLRLTNNKLSGSIPISIFNLPSIWDLDLSSNRLTGFLPSTINLPSIFYFLVYDNQLSGTLPGALFTQPTIGVINLSHNQFNETIPNVAFSSSIFALSTTIRCKIINLPNLSSLWLSSTGLTGSIGSRNSQLNAMTELHLDYSQFTSVGYISVTSVCSVGNNPFPCYPLQNVSALCNSIPPCPLLVTMRGIWQTLGGASQYWTGSNMCDSTDYVGVICDPNQIYPVGIDYVNGGAVGLKLSGTIPSDIGSLSNLTQLLIGDNPITGSIPDSLCNLSLLSQLDLSSMQLTGLIPSCIGNLNQLETVYLDNNRLTGSIPFLGESTNLLTLDISGNRMTGVIPDSICFPNVRNLIISSNNFTGSIPPCIEILDTFVASDNHLSGIIPDTSYDATSLVHLDLHNNGLSGSIPDSICRMHSLTYLNVQANYLTGSIPSCIGDANSLRQIVLDHNLLNGSIPSSIGSLASLTYLTLGSNSLVGVIPDSIGSLVELRTLSLHDNLLNGTIPSSIFNIPSLQTIDISRNRLTGNIPPIINSLDLTTILLNDNQLEGPIPDSIIDLPNLTHLSLEDNFLNGSVTKRNSTLPALVHLSLNDNFLTMIGYIDVTGLCNLTHNSFYCLPRLKVPSICTIDYLPCTGSPPVIDALYLNDTIMSVQQAEIILNSALSNDAQSLKTISAVTLALSRNTSFFEYITQNVSITLQSFHIRTNYSENIELGIANSSVSVAKPSSMIGSQEVTVSISSVAYNPLASIDDTPIYSPIIGVSIYAQGIEMEIEGVADLINITMGVVLSIPLDHCTNLIVNGNVTICQTNHLTNFSIGFQPIISPTRLVVDVASNDAYFKMLITIACCVAGGFILVLILALLKGMNTSMMMLEVADEKERVVKGERTEVWRVIQNETSTVAVKKRNAKDIRTLVQEAARLKNLTEGWLMIEWMHQGSLFSYARHHSVASLFFSIGTDVARGMSYVAEQGIVHTQLHPHHILLQISEGTVLAKITSFSESVADGTKSGQKPSHHTAPEVVKWGVQYLKSDVWSFGLVLDFIARDGPESSQGIVSDCMEEISCRVTFAEIARRLMREMPTDKKMKAEIEEQSTSNPISPRPTLTVAVPLGSDE